jgi:hypothetical protein
LHWGNIFSVLNNKALQHMCHQALKGTQSSPMHPTPPVAAGKNPKYRPLAQGNLRDEKKSTVLYCQLLNVRDFLQSGVCEFYLRTPLSKE